MRRRGELCLEAGADDLFIESPEQTDEIERIGRHCAGVPQLANMLEGGRTPLLAPRELHALGVLAE